MLEQPVQRRRRAPWPPSAPSPSASPASAMLAAERGRRDDARAAPPAARPPCAPSRAERSGRAGAPGRGGARPRSSCATGRARRRPAPARRSAPSPAIASATRRVPALAVAVRLHRPGAADDQPALRPGQRDVEQAPVLLPHQRRAAPPRPSPAPAGASSLRGRQAGQAVGEAQHLRRVDAVLAHRGVGQDHDRRLEPLGAVHRHHPHLVGALLGAALHLHLVAVDPVEEAGQARRLDLLVGERLVDQRVDAVLGLGPEPRDEPAPAAVTDQHPLDQLERPEEVRLRQQVGEERPRLGPALRRLPPQRRPEAAVAAVRELEELALADAAERAAQKGREREIVAAASPRSAAPPAGR